MALQSPLYQIHQRLGARMATCGSCELPSRYTSVQEEYEAVRKSAGLLDFSCRSLVEIHGSDRVRFLQGMLSNDVKALVEGKGLYTVFLTSQGKLVGDMVLYALQDSFLMECDAERKGGLLQALDRFVIAEEVRFSDLSDAAAILAVYGPRAAEVVAALSDSVRTLAQTYDHVSFPWRGAPVRVARAQWTGEEGFHCMAAREKLPELWQELIAVGERFSLRPVGWEAYQVLRVEAGIPLFGTDMDESHMPLEAGLEHALSTTKGCYVGQEVVARILYRGHVNRKLTGLRLQGGKVPEKGSTIVAGDKEIGQVTSAVFSPALGQPIALGYVRREFLTPGSKVEVKFNGDSASAEVAALPFYQKPSSVNGHSSLG